MTQPTAYVPMPALEMRDGMPVSSAFDDVYFSSSGGVAETTHVFLQGNGLPERWHHNADGGEYLRVVQGQRPRPQPFTIAELGFGTGLNFLVTMKAFRAHAHPTACLHYIAIEKFPFTPEQLRALLAQQPELAAEAAELLAAYPLRLPGLQRMHFGNVMLTLCFGDVGAMLEEMQAPIHAWYLDGFSPAKNPEMWGEALYWQMQRLSVAGTSFATFTAASHVRRGLEAVGFAVKKTAGYGRKREMSVGVLPHGGITPFAPERVDSTPLGVRTSGTAHSTVIVVGAGIAGATLARALAERGYQVTVLERGTVASGASGNAAGVWFPQITKQWGTPSAWYFAAYGYALHQQKRWHAQGLEFTHASCGMLRLPRHADEEMLLTHLNETHGLDARIVHWLSREEASAQAGVALQTGAAFFPAGTWLNPQQLCSALLQHAHITVRDHAPVQALTRAGDGWRVTLANGEAMEAAQCCITAAHESTVLLADYGINLGCVGGQVSAFLRNDAAAPLRSILCHSGYVIPISQPRVGSAEPFAAGVSDSEQSVERRSQPKGTRSPSIQSYLVGATYHRDDMLSVTDDRHTQNRAALMEILPQLTSVETVGGRSSIRATTPDRLPFIGAVDDGLYVATGFGSRGLLSAPLAAEMIASAIAGEPPPVTAALLRALNPLRFTKAPAPPYPQSLRA